MADENQVLWAGRDDIGLDALERVQYGLTVDMIMTPRDSLMTCRREDSVREVMARNTDNYSFLPVVNVAGRIFGLYRAEQWFAEEAPDQPIGDEFEALSEDLVIGADATITEFIRTADERPTRLVVSGHQIAGLIGLSDLQQLPVRAALFTLITSLEMAMVKRIEAEEWPDGADSWLELLTPSRRGKVSRAIDEAKQNDSFVSEIVLTQFADKGTIICRKGLIPGSKRKLSRDFRTIRKLRDPIAHANFYAETLTAARRVCSVVRTIFEIQQLLTDTIEKMKSSPRTAV